MAYYVNIYSNDGQQLLVSDNFDTNSFIVNKTGLMTSTGVQVYTYSGENVFNGFSSSAYGQIPDYTIGQGIELTNNLIIYEVDRSLNGVVYYTHGVLVTDLDDSEHSRGLFTEALSGVTISDRTAGTCVADNLYVNYDGITDYNANRQLVIQANDPGEHKGSNVYQYAAVRGDALVDYVQNTAADKALEDTVSALSGTINSNTNSITSIDGRVGTLEDSYSSLDGRVSTVEGTLSTLGETVSGLTNTTSSLEDELEVTTSDVDTLKGVLSYASDVATVGNSSAQLMFVGSNTNPVFNNKSVAMLSNVQDMLGRTTRVTYSDTNYKKIMARGSALYSSKETLPTENLVNGTIYWIYE